jgi:hypothetical protein
MTETTKARQWIRFVLLAAALGAHQAFAFSYTDQDLLLIFRRDGANDVIYDLGSVTNFLGRPAGFQMKVAFDKSVALGAYQNNLANGVHFSLMATTAGATPIAQKRLWVSSANPADQPLNSLPSVLSSMGSLVASVGRNANQQAGGNGVQSWSVPASANTSYTYVMTGDGTNPQGVDLLNGYWSYNVAGLIPSSVRFFQVQGSSVKPHPPAIQVGSFSLSAAGSLVFVAGSGPVTDVNAAPSLPTIPTQTVSEFGSLTVTNTATDSNVHATLSYALVNPPSGMLINAAGIITWTPSQNQSPSTNLVTTVATATDSLDPINPVLKSTNTFTVVVKEVNGIPVLSSVPSKTINELTLLTVTNTATDSNVHARLTYGLVNPPSGMSIDANGVITWTPAQNQSPSTNLVTTVATATDTLDAVNPVLKATNTFNVLVKEVNSTPVLLAISSKTVNELSLLTVTNSATDSNVHAKLTYSLVNPPSGMSINANGVITWTPGQNQSPSTNLVTTVATATDTLDTVNPVLKATNMFTVVVKEVNVVPTLPSIQTTTVNELTLLTVTNTATDSNIHAKLTYALVNPPSGMSINTNGVIIWTPSQNQSPSTNLVTTVATATDTLDTVNPVLKATNTFKVAVKEVNVAPVMRSIALQTATELSLLTVTNTASDSNIHAILSYVLVNPPAGMSINTNGIVTWTPAHSQSSSTNLIITIAKATDAFDLVHPILTSSNQFTVVVKRLGGDRPASSRQVAVSVTPLSKSDGIFRLKVEGPTGVAYALMASESLTSGDWTTLQVFTPESSPFIISDTNSAAMPERFYRVEILGAGAP